MSPRKRIAVAALITLVGCAVFLLVRAPFGDLIGSPWYLGGCVVGAFGSSLAWFDEKRLRWNENVAPALAIVATTYACIGLGHAAGKVWAGGTSVIPDALSEGFGVVMWAVFVTSWWLMPSAAATLTVVARGVGRW